MHDFTKRGTFHAKYAMPKDTRHPTKMHHRLNDCLVTVAAHPDPGYLGEPDKGQFAVVDLVRREKGFFEIPHGATIASLHAMIEGTMGAAATRINEKTWAV